MIRSRYGLEFVRGPFTLVDALTSAGHMHSMTEAMNSTASGAQIALP